ncbi:MAG: hypothetical protein IH600_08270 [Bacteroidetes bacterium]|nr:hypothetical protein [Bacteroidota bacterium]
MNMLRKNPDSVETAGEGQPRRFRTRIPGYTIRLLALIGIALLVWKLIAVSVLESEQEDALQALRDSTEQRIADRTAQLGRAAGEAFSLAVLQAVRSGDEKQLKNACQVLARRTTVNDYLVVNTSGVIIAAAASDMVGESVDENLRRTIGSVETPIVDTIENGLTRVISPLRDETGDFGTVILTFRLS